ncbi:protein wos2 [Phialemonium atrogriseum]|uniref:Protein wos2 n=1 Tax=Phialemonium atrogriseum TaxID=1093897 RepID=A0AAJ0FTQ0_9PEZI|nr:protein wos2 [Phialemonium atrogriseum]KAK1772380.1 protein wos2 [Phialemonium atrogriseum]
MSTATPEVLWAQRSSNTDAAKNFIYLTISVPDVPASNLKLDLKPQSLTFTGHSDSLKKTYHLELEFYAEIDAEESKINHTGKNVEIHLRKKELDDAYWPRLLKDSKKVHFLKTDFDKWVDEDEQNEVAEQEDMSNFGGMGGGDFGGIDFSKLGGGAGLGGMPEDGDEEDSDDDEMPALEDAEEEAASAAKPAEGEAEAEGESKTKA